MVKLTCNNCHNEFIFNGRYINNIIFYNDNGLITETKRGWFGNSNNGYEELEVGEIKIRNKTILNKLNKQENFVIPIKDEFNNSKYDLYLYIDNTNIKIISETIKEQKMSSTYIQIFNIFKISIFDEIVEVKNYLTSKTTEFGDKVKKIYKELQNLSINIDEYTLSLIMENFDIVKK